jgi:anti-sigma-K factor RskA
MEYRNKPQLRDALAAEYVLGTLAGRARRRFEAWLKQDAALRITVNEWETRLTPMAAAVQAVQPPERVWERVSKAIAPKMASTNASGQVAGKNSGASLWESLAFWRGFGLTTATGFAALMVFVGVRPPEVVERIKVVEKVVERAVPVADGTAAHQPSYVAALKDGQGNTMMMIYAGRKAGEMWVKFMGDSMPADASLELWGLDMNGNPKSLGLVKAMGKNMIKLPDIADKSLHDYKKLAVSMEPMGGSTSGKPTGPVMYQGDCMTMW